MGYFDPDVPVPDAYISAVRFALPNEATFTFGRPFPSRRRLEEIFADGYVVRAMKTPVGGFGPGTIAKSVWPLPSNESIAYQMMRFQARDTPYYLVFGIPREDIEHVSDEIRAVYADADVHIPAESEPRDTGWRGAVDTIVELEEGKLPPHFVKGFIEIPTVGETPQDNDALIPWRITRNPRYHQ